MFNVKCNTICISIYLIINTFYYIIFNKCKGIQKFIGCDISIIELVFIFDKDIQINEINKGGFSGAKYCITNNILFYLFSMNDYCLYSSYDMKNFYRVENFVIKKKTRKRNFNNSKGDFSFLNKEEIELINNGINDDYFI